jgi:hypothetical protein
VVWLLLVRREARLERDRRAGLVLQVERMLSAAELRARRRRGTTFRASSQGMALRMLVTPKAMTLKV